MLASLACSKYLAFAYLQAFQKAIARVVKKIKASAGAAHVVDLGTGSGLLAMMAATAGAASVVACDIHDSLCSVARQVGTCFLGGKIALLSCVYCSCGWC